MSSGFVVWHFGLESEASADFLDAAIDRGVELVSAVEDDGDNFCRVYLTPDPGSGLECVALVTPEFVCVNSGYGTTRWADGWTYMDKGE